MASYLLLDSLKIDPNLLKINQLINLLEKDFKKYFPASDSNPSEFIPQFDYLTILRKTYDIYFLCLFEITHKLQSQGLDNIGNTIIKLFQIFKVQMTYFLKFNISFFKMNKYFYKEEVNNTKIINDLEKNTKSNEFTSDQLNLLRFILKKKGGNTNTNNDRGNNYEKLEKASFFLEQEKFELEKMLMNYNNSKDEIDEFLKKRVNLDQIHASGVIKYLQTILKQSKLSSTNVNFLLDKENEEIDKQTEKYRNADFRMDEMKSDLLSKVNAKTRNMIKNAFDTKKKPKNMKKECETQTELSLNDLQDQLLNSANTGILRKQLASLLNEKKDLQTHLEVIESHKSQLHSKISILDKKIIDQSKEILKLNEKIQYSEFKISKKKTKNNFLKQEIKDLLEKLEAYVDKDTINRTMLKNKNEDIEKNHSQSRIKEKELQNTIKNLIEEKDQFKINISKLEEELKTHKDLLEMYNNQINEDKILSESKIVELKKKDKDKDKVRRSSSILKLDTIKSMSKKIENEEKNSISKKIENEEKNEFIFSQKSIKEINNIKNDEKNEKSNTLFIPKKSVNTPRKSFLDVKVIEEQEEITQKPEIIKSIKNIDPLISQISILLENSHNSKLIKENIKFILENKDKNISELLKKIETEKQSQKNRLTILEKQENLIKSQSDIKNPIHNQKPITIVKEIIQKIDDPLYEEYCRWKKLNKIEEMTIFMHKKMANLKEIENQKNLLKSPQNNNFKNPNKTFEFRPHTEQGNKLNKKLSTPYLPHTQIFPKPQNYIEDTVEKNDKTKELKKIIKKIAKTEIDSPRSPLSQKKNKNSDNDEENYAHNKHLFRYPFKKIIEGKIENKNEKFSAGNYNKELDEYFEKLYEKLVKMHEKCGGNCQHLKRFYHRVGFVNRYLQKEEYSITKSIIDKLPLLDSL